VKGKLETKMSRRSFLKGAVAGAAFLGGPGIPYIARNAAAEPPPIKVAIVDALSGAYSRNGNLGVQGTKALMGWYNDRGGIKSLGGAKFVPVIADNKSTVEGSANAMERLCRDPDILIAQPTWGSSFAMAATEVTERLGIPSFTTGFSEKLNERGFKYGFYPYPGFLDDMRLGVPVVLDMFKSMGREIKTQFVTSSNNISDLLFCQNTQKFLAEKGIKTLGTEYWPIGTLTDASPIMQKIKRENPDIVIYGGSAVSEMQLFLMKQKELQMKNTIFLASSGYLGDPTLKFGGEYLDSWLGLTPSFYHKRTPPEWHKRMLDQCRKEYSDEPWAGQELGFPWCLVPVYAEALERAGSRDHKVIRDTIAKLDIQGTMTTSCFVKNAIAFEPNGRLATKYCGIMVIQWQKGTCYAVYPPDIAMAKPRLVF